MIETNLDPVREVRTARRWALLAILGAALALTPFYAAILGLSGLELAFVLAPASLAAFVSVELASRWESRMRRRYVYPHRLGYELASIYEFPRACQHSAELLGRWLEADAIVVAWLTEDDNALAPAAAFGLPAGWLRDAPRLPLAGQELGRALEETRLLRSPARPEDPWFSGFSRDQVTYVPLVSRERSEGVLAVAAGRGNRALADTRLLAALGTMMGLALDNCRLYESQRAHAQRLQQLNSMKSDFLSTVSHELRTPLTSIMMAAEMLLEDEDAKDPNSARGRLVRAIVKGASRLTSLVADLVNVSREDEFQPRLELDPLPLSDTITNTVAIIQPLLTAKHQSIDVQFSGADAVIMADRLRFEQILINLLSNAQRYSPPGGHIVVSSRVVKDEAVISVTDSGPGISAEDAELIFEPFYRGDRSGLGLGLAIAKSLVELHNGRIWVESRPGRGSAFNVALPTHSESRPRRLESPLRR